MNSCRREALRSQIASDGYSPARYRATTARNLWRWTPAFDGKPRDKWDVPPEKPINVW